MKKKIFKSLLAIACLLSSTSVSAYDFEVDGLYYNVASLPNLTASITHGNATYIGAISIPSTVVYMGRTFKIIYVEPEAFYGCKNLTSVTIPESVTSIGSYAFGKCTGLTSITIPKSVTRIEERPLQTVVV